MKILLREYWSQLALIACCLLLLTLWQSERVGHAGAEQRFAEFKADKAEAERRTEAEYRAKETRWRAQQQEIENATQQDLERVRTELADARTAGDKLRVALDTWRKRSAAASATVATVGPNVQSDDPIGMLADLLDRADIRAEKVHRYADELRVTGLACEARYDAVASP